MNQSTINMAFHLTKQYQPAARARLTASVTALAGTLCLAIALPAQSAGKLPASLKMAATTGSSQTASPATPAVMDPFAPPEGVPADIDRAVRIAAIVHKVDAALIHAVIQQESRYNRRAVSPKGAQGLMQLMPETAKRLGVGNAFDEVANINGGAKYLRQLKGMFKDDLKLVLAAYNAGEQAVVNAGNKVPPFPETQAYVPGVMANYQRLKLAMAQGLPVTAPALPPQLAVSPAAVNAAPSQAPLAMDKAATVAFTEAVNPLLMPATPIYVIEGASAQDGLIDATSVTVLEPPSRGGEATVLPSGVVAYRPAMGFKGSETFTYTVSDVRGTRSNPATVTVTIR